MQCLDCSFTKANRNLETVGKNPTDHGKGGSKKSLLIDARGDPLILVLTPANRYNALMLGSTTSADFGFTMNARLRIIKERSNSPAF